MVKSAQPNGKFALILILLVSGCAIKLSLVADVSIEFELSKVLLEQDQIVEQEINMSKRFFIQLFCRFVSVFLPLAITVGI